MRLLRCQVPVWLMLSLSPAVVWAHGVFPGGGDLANGLLHPFFVPTHLLALLGLSLLLGLRGKAHILAGFYAFASALLLGLIGAGMGVASPLAFSLHAVSLLCGGLAAADVPVKSLVTTLLAAMTGLLLGLDSAPENIGLLSLLMTFAGILIGANAGMLGLVGWLTDLKYPWQRVGVRIVGSWITAISLLMLALSSKR